MMLSPDCALETFTIHRGYSKARKGQLMSTRIAATHVRLKRAYEPPAAGDGTRILIDRLWPRGVSKADAAIDRG